MSEQYKSILPALGIYPIDAVNDAIPADFPFEVAAFDVNEEIKFIAEQAKNKKIVAVGECGLDGHWLAANSFKQQENVFMQLIEIAKKMIFLLSSTAES